MRATSKLNGIAIAAAAAAALDAAAGGATFAGVCERIAAWIAPDQVAVRAAGLLKRWIADGLVAAAKTD